MASVMEELLNEGRAEGRMEGQLFGWIQAYKEVGLNLEAVIEKIMTKFDYSREDAAEKVVLIWNTDDSRSQ